MYQRFAFSGAFNYGGGHAVGDQPNRADRIIVARNGVVNQVWIAVAVDKGEYLDPHAACFGDADIFFGNVDHEHSLGRSGHVPQAHEVFLQLRQFFRQLETFFFGKDPEVALIPLLLQIYHVVYSSANGLEIGEGSPQPPLVDVPHSAAFGFGLNNFLGLLLGADKEDFAAISSYLHHGPISLVEQSQGLLEVYDVDAVALSENVALHAGIPSAGLMPKMDTGLQ